MSKSKTWEVEFEKPYRIVAIVPNSGVHIVRVGRMIDQIKLVSLQDIHIRASEWISIGDVLFLKEAPSVRNFDKAQFFLMKMSAEQAFERSKDWETENEPIDD